MSDIYWCGDELTLEAVQSAQARVPEMIAARMKSGSDSGMPEMPSMYKRHGTVGVIDISGPLVAGDAGYMRFFGITGYDNIRSALMEGVKDKDAKSLMLNINSGGGSVNGVSDTGRFIKSVAQIKPVTAYADTAASAAYWLGSASSHITAAETGTVGSIGVLRVHSEHSKADAQEGITTTILRAGRYKALMNPVEPLSEDARAQADVMLQDLYKSFVSMVAENRGVSYKVAHEKMADGREFMGQRGLEVGLIDKVGTYEEALAHAASMHISVNRSSSATGGVAKASVDDNNAANPKQGTLVMKPTLDAETLAMATGITNAGDEAAAAAAAVQAAAVSATADEPKIEDIQAELATATSAVEAANTQVATLTTQLTEAQASVASFTEAATAAQSTIASLTAIVSAYTANMVIALGGKKDGIDAMSASDLLAKHDETLASFTAKFKQGGVARSLPLSGDTAATATPAKVVVKANVTPMFAHLVKHVTVK